MKTCALAVIALALLAACGGKVGEATPGSGGDAAPGTAVDLNALIGVPVGTFTWGVVAAPENSDAFSAGLSLTAAGLLTMPDCRYTSAPPSGLPRAWPFCVTVTATRNSVVEFSLSVCADERLLSSKVACAMLTGDTLCRDPALPITIGVGETVQFFSLVRATCTTTYTPPLPPGACPPLDPLFAFCR